MKRLLLLLSATLLAVLLLREPDAPLRGCLNEDEVPAPSRSHPTPHLMRGPRAPRLQGVAMDAAVQEQAGRRRGGGSSEDETARVRGEYEAQWKEIMADLESTGNYHVVETVVFPENWLDEAAEESRGSSTPPTVSGAPAR